jgi:hypothetical protein
VVGRAEENHDDFDVVSEFNSLFLEYKTGAVITCHIFIGFICCRAEVLFVNISCENSYGSIVPFR